MSTRAIRTEGEYRASLEEVERLMAEGENLSAEESDRLEVFTILIEAYENSRFPVEPPDPIDAIHFRMEEKGLKQADLIPYFGTSSRVSEVLKRKRPLTVQMIRAISIGLGISADTLIGLSAVDRNEDAEVDWSKFPAKEMIARGWLKPRSGRATSVEDMVRSFISGAGFHYNAAAFRRTLAGEATSPTTMYALYAWLARIVQRTRQKKPKLGVFEPDRLNSVFLRELAQLSWSERGPQLAVEYLQRNGIAVIVESQLKGTQLDGAALKDIDGTPTIALTLRFDRLDNFWFTLLHEVVHIWKHVGNATDTFVDDLNTSSTDRREAEANRLASEAFIPRLIWKRSDAFLAPSKESIEKLAKTLRIHPAVIVGRLHKETGNYALFNSMIGHRQVRSALATIDD